MAPRREDPTDLLITGDLIERAQGGDSSAMDALLARYRPRLARWATGRLPAFARSLFDTSDLVQETLLQAIERIDKIEVRGPGLFQAYVRRAVLNRINDQVRWAKRRPGPDGVPEEITDPRPSPLESAIGSDFLDRFERGLEQLTEEQRQVVHLRIELDFGFEEIAVILGRSSADAVRMSFQRSLRKLAEVMGHERT